MNLKHITLLLLACFAFAGNAMAQLSYTHYWYDGKFYTNAGHTTESGYTTLEDLIAAETSVVVRLDDDYSASSSAAILVESGSSLTIDLNDNTLQASGTARDLFSVKGVLNIYNTPGTTEVDNSIYFKVGTGSPYVNTTYTIDKGKIVLCEGVRCADVNNGGTLNLYSGTIMGTSADVTVPIHDDGYTGGIMTGLVRNTPGTGAGTQGDGGAFHVNNASSFNMYGGVITKCTAGAYTHSSNKYHNSGGGGWGGAISILADCTGHIENGKIQFCQAAYAAGAINNYGTLTIDNGDYDYNMCVCDYGSFLYLREGGTLTINGGNYRYGTGGGQYTDTNVGAYGFGYLFELWAGHPILSNVTITGGVFEKSNGSAFYCGGVMAYNLNITNAEMRYNGSSGIKLSSYVGSATIGTGTKIHDNHWKTTGGEGGGICLTTGSLTLTGNVEVYDNRAAKGGGIYADGGNGTLTINSGLNVHDNTATEKGGGIYVKNDFTMHGGTINSNTATQYGGGICVETPFEVNVNLNGGTISNNSAGIDGGGLAAIMTNVPAGNHKQTFTSNWGLSAFSLTYPATRVVEFTLPSGYSLPSGVTEPIIDGHLIYIGNPNGTGGPAQGSTPASTVTYEVTQGTVAHVAVGKDDGSAGPTITGNHADSGNGGGIYQGKGDMTVYAGVVSNNGSNNGAGLYINTGGTVHVKGGSITGNTASVNGGGIYVNPGSGTTSIDCTKANTTISGNSAVLGAGAYVASGTLTIDGPASGSKYTKLIGNTASTSGGGVYVAAGTVTVTNAIIGASGSANTATNGNGGGIYVIGDATITNSTMAYNKAPATTDGNGLGGGVYVATGGTFTLDGGSVNNNSAGNNGGGFYVDPGSGATTYIKNLHGNVTVNSNEAKLGAGAYVASGDLDIDGTTSGKTFVMSSNIASVSGGGAYVQGGTIGINKATLNANKANNGNGGGIYVSGDATVTGASTLSNNEASASGGGIYVASGSATVNGGSILSGNQAKGGSGGGIYAAGTTTASGSSTFNGNTAQVSGGGIYVASGNAEVTSCILTNNTATTGNGGGIYAHGNTTVTTSNLSGNQALSTTENYGLGGGVYVASNSTFELVGGSVSGNTAGTNGGGFYVNPGADKTTTISSSASITGNHAVDGAGAYIASGSFVLDGSSATSNIATGNGGGFYVNPGAGKTTTIRNVSTISGNQAVNGGGAYVASGTLTVQTAGAKDGVTVIKSNTASTSGGGLYVAAGSVTLTNVTIGGDVTGDGNTATSGDGGGIYAGGEVTATSSIIKNNKAPGGNGGGIYANAGSGNDIIVQTSSIISSNSAANGGGIFALSGDVEVIGASTMSGNIASNAGGGVYANGGSVTVNNTGGGEGFANLAILTENHAANGGAIYANGGVVAFSDGTISLNYASNRGGALYITEDGELTLQGTAKLTKNHVPTNGKGGGVYLAGVVKAGTEGGTIDSPKHDVIIADDNFAFTTVTPGDYTPTDATRNNIYLPDPRVNGDDASNDEHKDVITVYAYGMELTPASGKDGDKSHLGFSVPRNYVPVIFCSDNDYLNNSDNFANIRSTVFDDTHRYTANHYPSTPGYNSHYIYLSGEIWTDVVTLRPEGFPEGTPAAVTITTPQQLAWLISYVNGNGLNGVTDPHPNVNVTLGADINMGANEWTPIGYGSNSQVYTGTFNGNGHVISNIITNSNDNHALFGRLGNGADVKNLILDKIDIRRTGSGSAPMGSIAIEIRSGATVENCGVNGNIYSEGEGTVMGGISARMTGGTIKNCYVTADMTGYTIGGLVGQMTGGAIYNSFAYPKTTYSGPYVTVSPPSSTNYYVGGLVAVMSDASAVVENCYCHEQSGSNHGTTSKFGWLAGNYTAGAFNYSYAPESSPYIYQDPEDPKILAKTGYGYFTPTDLGSGKYRFAHNDQKVTAVQFGDADNPYIMNGPIDNNGNLKGLLVALNGWVEAHGGQGYYTWTRTMASPINDDCPVLKYTYTFESTNFKCVGSDNGTSIRYESNINDMIAEFNDKGYIYPYEDPDTITSSTNGTLKIYIPENMGIKQSDDVTTNARVGVTFDNSKSDPSLWGEAYAWHMFSSALADAPLGVVYNPNEDPYTPAYGAKPPVTGWYQSDDPTVTATYDPAKVGYFPTDTPYGYPYTTTAKGSFDLYCYYEPYAHWINFKRDSNDHWHTMDHYNIHYTNEEGVSGNEDHFIKGKGYLAAISKTSMLMAEGTLNNGVVQIKTSYTDPGYYYGNDLNGVNLIGNPYQSYLDFNVFADTNSATLRTNAYYILDADKGGYVGYVPGASSSDVAPRFLHPHQGFLVLVKGNYSSLKFTNTMRNTEAEATEAEVAAGGAGGHYFRGEHIAYPLVSMTCTDSDGMNDFAIVELGRPETGGGEKLKGMHSGDASIWFHFDETDWYTAFTTPGINEAPLRFRAYEDGVFTLTWHPENAEFSYLHLIDNITGSDVDCLATDKYVFEGRVTDYTSRFRLKFDYSEENGSGTESETFAFMMGNELVVNGEGVLQVFDVMGRQIMGMEMQSIQSTVTLPDVANGVYVLRLTTGNLTKTQKLVINK